MSISGVFLETLEDSSVWCDGVDVQGTNPYHLHKSAPLHPFAILYELYRRALREVGTLNHILPIIQNLSLLVHSATNDLPRVASHWQRHWHLSSLRYTLTMHEINDELCELLRVSWLFTTVELDALFDLLHPRLIVCNTGVVDRPLSRFEDGRAEVAGFDAVNSDAQWCYFETQAFG